MTINIRDEDLCVIHIGLDDFDFYLYGCTTHVTTFFLNQIIKRIPIQLLDYPNLVRLNPSIPWKTRGNGAIALRIAMPCSYIDNLISYVDNILLEYYEKLADITSKNYYHIYDKEPGIVIAVDPLPKLFSEIYLLALTDVVPIPIVTEKLAQNNRNIYISNIFRGRGIIGAIAAIGWITHNSDYTYELITYRSKKRYMEKRCICLESVKLFDNITSNTTFNNIDDATGRVLITSHGHDPVLYGVRGDDVFDLKKALDIIKTCEPITAWTIFRTNQGTDVHAIDRCINDLRIYHTARIKVRISSKPISIPGGHIIIKGSDATSTIDMIFFRPSRLTSIAQKLIIGDEVVVQGHVKPWRDGLCFHVEKLVVTKLSRQYTCRSPRCPICKKRMIKKGFGKGYECSLCGYKSLTPTLECIKVKRDLSIGIYLPLPAEQKHLIKPLKRYGKEKHHHPLPHIIPINYVTQIIEPLDFL